MVGCPLVSDEDTLFDWIEEEIATKRVLQTQDLPRYVRATRSEPPPALYLETTARKRGTATMASAGMRGV
jgi:hypothetical protein